MKKTGIILLIVLLGISTKVEAQVHLRFGTPGIHYSDSSSFGDFVSFAYWIVNEGPDTLVDPVEMNLMVTDSIGINSTTSFLGNYALTNNHLAPNDSLFIVSWDNIHSFKYVSGDNIVVIWPNFISPTTPLSYDIFTGNLFVSSTSSVQEKVTENELLIYPNPVIETAVIETRNRINIEKFRMLDVSGMVVRDIQISNQYHVMFHKRGLPKGIYFIEITTNEKKYLQKIIIH
jgi:hypothetical protein